MTAAQNPSAEIVCRLVRRLLGSVGVGLGPPASSFYAADLREGLRAPAGVEVPPGTRLLVVEPVRSKDGLPMASIVVADGSPRQLSARDRESLRDIATLAASAMSARADAGQEQALRAERLLELSQEGFALAERGILLDVSPALTRMFGADPHRMVGRSVLELVLPDQHDEFLRVMSGDRSGSLETIGVRADQRLFAMEVTHRCLSGDALCALNFRDLTEQRQRERQRSEFFTGMGHELRTPLGSLRAALGLLRRRGLPDEARALVQISQSHAESLSRLVSDLVDHESILSGKILLTLTPVDALALVEQALRNAQARASERKVGLVFDHSLGGRRVHADTLRLGQALTLLLEHSVLATPAGSLVEVRAEGEEDRITLTVEHPGLPPEPPSRLFDAFAGGDMAADVGSGHQRLGLSLARAILRRHGGELDASVGGQGGTRFDVRLGVWRAPVELAEAPAKGNLDAIISGRDVARTSLLAMILREGGLKSRVLAPGESLANALRQGGARVLVLADDATPPVGVPRGVRVLAAPADPRALADEVRALIALGPAEPPRVLYVEDDPDHAELMVAILAGVAETFSVSTLAQARSALREQQYQVVLTDIGLPDGSGLELVEELRGQGDSAPRVIIFSARTLDSGLPPGVRVLMKASVSNDELRDAVLSML